MRKARYGARVGRRVVSQRYRNLAEAGVIPVQSMHAFVDLKSKPRTFQVTILEEESIRTVE